jgi:nucleoside-diphosphate-sugar epimerase
MKIAILGARGFVGGNLGRMLSAKGHKVTGFVLDPDSGLNPGFECKSVYELINSPIGSGSIYDVTINLAARRATRDFPFTEQQVSEFTYEIPKQFILKTADVSTLVINSSTYIQNFEGKSGNTVDSYGASKEKLSRFLEDEATLEKFRTLDLYFFTLYGFGDRPNHLVPLLLEAAATSKMISLSPGKQLMNLLFIEDAIQNIIGALDQKDTYSYQKNYVWSNEYFTVQELVERIQDSIGMKINCDWGARDYVGHEMMSPWTVPMEQLPWFAAPTKLEEGIKKTWGHFK